MRCQNDAATTIKVAPCADVSAVLPKRGVLRFERKGGAMAGNPAMSFDEDGALSLFFADGASLELRQA